MKNLNNLQPDELLTDELKNISVTVNDIEEFPTREEFYTNYPFFKYWKSEDNSKLFEQAGINIYIHIPFCIQICDYCFYMKELVKSPLQVDSYLDSICAEMKMVSESLNLKKRRVNSIYIGGGTPSVLTEKQFRKLVDALHKYHLIENPEFTFEAEPGTFAKSKLLYYKDCGVNRISMGVQSFDDEVIKLSSRKHSADQALNSINMIKEVGGFKMNIDLLSGLAGETMESWEKSVNVSLREEVDMLTIYKMKTYANTVFFKKGVHTNEIELPKTNQEIDFMKAAIQKIRDANYNSWSTFAFTIDGHHNHYAENTWRGQDLIAYGASSFGKIGNINYQNVNNLDLYMKKVSEDQTPVYRTYSLTAKDQMIKELLLCAVRLKSYKKAEFIKKFGFDYMQLIPETIYDLLVKGYITSDFNELVLTDQGVLFGDFVGKVIASAVKSKLGKDSIGFTY